MHSVTARVLDKAAIAEGMVRLVLDAAPIAREARPGQFVMVRTEAGGALLGRPLGVSGADDVAGELTLRFASAGKGTAWLAARRPGDSVRVSGPMGRGFTLGSRNALLIGGGTGLAPLFFLKESIERERGNVTLLAGARNRLCLMESDLLASGCIIATEDGSLGEKGLVTEPLERMLVSGHYDTVYACGPLPMLKAVKELAIKAGVPLEVSLETQMGCGVGACNGCTCRQAPKNGGWAKVCKDGPVFPAWEVLL